MNANRFGLRQPSAAFPPPASSALIASGSNTTLLRRFADPPVTNNSIRYSAAPFAQFVSTKKLSNPWRIAATPFNAAA